MGHRNTVSRLGIESRPDLACAQLEVMGNIPFPDHAVMAGDDPAMAVIAHAPLLLGKEIAVDVSGLEACRPQRRDEIGVDVDTGALCQAAGEIGHLVTAIIEPDLRMGIAELLCRGHHQSLYCRMAI